MKKILSVLAIILLFASCGGGYNPPVSPGGNNNNTEPVPEVVVNASFNYKKEHPFYVVFTNNSTNGASCSWDFGDGSTSTELNPIHKYAGKGVYNVTLTVRYNSKSAICKKQITVVEPTTCYITGFVFNKIPYNNEYYKIKMTDDDAIFVDTYINTSWVLLSSANIPYTYNFSNKYKLNLSDTYILHFYYSTKASGDGTKLKTWTLPGSDIYKKFSEKRLATSDNMEFITLLEWKD